jgi:hypothetical protein
MHLNLHSYAQGVKYVTKYTNKVRHEEQFALWHIFTHFLHKKIVSW